MSSAMDTAILRDILIQFLESERILGKQSELGEQAVRILEKLPGFGVGRHGQLMEWREDYEEWEIGHRHFSHLYPIFPSNQINEYENEELLEAGVQIFEYEPGFIHSKNFVVDDLWATVGTVNLDYRSLFLHFEDGVWLCEAPCIRDIRADFEATLKASQPCSLRQFKHLNILLQLYRSILRVFAPLM